MKYPTWWSGHWDLIVSPICDTSKYSGRLGVEGGEFERPLHYITRTSSDAWAMVSFCRGKLAAVALIDDTLHPLLSLRVTKLLSCPYRPERNNNFCNTHYIKLKPMIWLLPTVRLVHVYDTKLRSATAIEVGRLLRRHRVIGAAGTKSNNGSVYTLTLLCVDHVSHGSRGAYVTIREWQPRRTDSVCGRC